MNDLKAQNNKTGMCNARDYFFRCKNEENDELKWFKSQFQDFQNSENDKSFFNRFDNFEKQSTFVNLVKEEMEYYINLVDNFYTFLKKCKDYIKKTKKDQEKRNLISFDILYGIN